MTPRNARRPFTQVDVFAAQAGMGNPLAVVLDAEGLDEAQMQAIAAWTNLAETTFVLPPSREGAHYRVRIFTTRREIAFAGHPSIGTAYAIIGAGLVPTAITELVQECQAGLLPVQVTWVGDRADVLSVRVPRSIMVRFEDASDDTLRRTLAGVERGALPPALVEGGRRWWLAELASEAQVRAMQPDRSLIRKLADESDSLGLCVFARATGGPFDLVVRAFPLGVGIDEDPASGAANAAIAAFLDEAGALGKLGDKYRVSQGREMGRDAQLRLRLDGGRQVWVGGQCRTAINGRFSWRTSGP